jgi:hypothetical protein
MDMERMYVCMYVWNAKPPMMRRRRSEERGAKQSR